MILVQHSFYLQEGVWEEAEKELERDGRREREGLANQPSPFECRSVICAFLSQERNLSLFFLFCVCLRKRLIPSVVLFKHLFIFKSAIEFPILRDQEVAHFASLVVHSSRLWTTSKMREFVGHSQSLAP